MYFIGRIWTEGPKITGSSFISLIVFGNTLNSLRLNILTRKILRVVEPIMGFEVGNTFLWARLPQLLAPKNSKPIWVSLRTLDNQLHLDPPSK